MEIRVEGPGQPPAPVTVTMRTPGNDFDLAVGFLLSEGVVRDAVDVAGVRYCAGATADGGNTYNVVDVRLATGVPAPDASLERNFYTTSSCGVCGKGALEAVAVEAARVDSRLIVPLATVESLPGRLGDEQAAFAATGGLHATGLFTAAGELVCLREDVGRHNAFDKVVGWAFLEDRLPLAEVP